MTPVPSKWLTTLKFMLKPGRLVCSNERPPDQGTISAEPYSIRLGLLAVPTLLYSTDTLLYNSITMLRIGVIRKINAMSFSAAS